MQTQQQRKTLILFLFVAIVLLPVTQGYTEDIEELSKRQSKKKCDAAACHQPLTGLENSNRFKSSDYVRDLLNPKNFIKTRGGNVSYFNLSTTPALAGIGVAFSLAMLEPCGIILPHIHPRGSKGIYNINGKSLLVGFIQENRAQLILNEISIGHATVIPRGAIHFVQNLECTPAMELAAYNYEDPGLLTLGSNMFRFPDAPLSAAFGRGAKYIDALRQTIPAYPLDLDIECRKRCKLST